MHPVGNTSFWKLVDFDAARSFVDKEKMDCLTTRYAAPEIVVTWEKGGFLPAHPSMDIWSLGCILYEMYTGLPLIDGLGGKEDAIIAQLTRETDIFPESLIDDNIPDEQARNLLRKLLRHDPKERIGIHMVLQSAYFRAGWDTQMMMKRHQSLLEVVQTPSMNLISTNLVTLNRKADLILNSIDSVRMQLYDSLEYQIPKLFIILPQPEAKSWTKPR
jgi:serine/threonine protein kinase